MKEIIIDGASMNTRENMLYRGIGMVSANNSSRLLLDYKAEKPEIYDRLLRYIFGNKGIGVNHLKIEMGSDINSSSGTEPAVKRTAEEKADVTRGAGFQLAADAKKINPELTLDMLWWSEPKWVSDSPDLYAARYRWYKESLDAAYNTYGLKFDYVSAVQNERAIDPEWVKYLSARLKSEADCPYDYSKIKIVGGEGVCTWQFAEMALKDRELSESVDVIGSHYTSASTPEAQKLALEQGKELWFSEASSPMNYARGAESIKGGAGELSGINGTLDIANRLVGMYPNGKMTLCELQPVISAYYDGACYCSKQLITACDPWSGYYFLDSGFYMALHFSRFIKKGWAFIDSGCFSDGKAGGDGHAIVDAVYSFLTAADTKTGDYSAVIVNSTDKPIEYAVKVKNIAKAAAKVNIRETRGHSGGAYNENYFKCMGCITPEKEGEFFAYKITLKPCSMLTISTLEITEEEYICPDLSEREILPLPYRDDFRYSNYPENYLASRGFAPRYTTDQGGAFEVEKTETGNFLVQQITTLTKAKEWGYTPEPVTCLGEDRWYNYSVSVDVKFAASEKPDENYVGAGLRYILACDGYSGYWIQLFEDGGWRLNADKMELASGKLSSFEGSKLHKIKIAAQYDTICAYIDGEKAAEITEKQPIKAAGRAALYSSYNKNGFANLLIEPLGENPYITRFDNTDSCFSYLGEWSHNTMSSFRNFNRTISEGGEGTTVRISFFGTGFALTGETAERAAVSLSVDDSSPAAKTIEKTGAREISLWQSGLERKTHTAEITVISGKIGIDGIQVEGGNED